MNGKIWFGIPGRSMQWALAPNAGFTRSLQGHAESVDLESGRRINVVTAQRTTHFEGDFYGSNDDLDGINVYSKYASGFYGQGPLIFADPYAAQQNMFAAHWASPGLAEAGWDYLTGLQQLNPVSYGGIPSNGSFGRPLRYADYPIVTEANAAASAALRYNHYLAIPPDRNLWLGVSALAVGTAAVMVQTFNVDNTANTPVKIPLLDFRSQTHMNLLFPGAQYNALRVFITRTDSTTTSRLGLYSMMAQLWDNRIPAPDLPREHIAGVGHMGLKVVGDAIAETYAYYGVQKSLNLVLEETVY